MVQGLEKILTAVQIAPRSTPKQLVQGCTSPPRRTMRQVILPLEAAALTIVRPPLLDLRVISRRHQTIILPLEAAVLTLVQHLLSDLLVITRLHRTIILPLEAPALTTVRHPPLGLRVISR